MTPWKLETIIAIGGFLIGLGTTLCGVLAWYSSSVRKKYAAEREFNHLRNNQQQIQAGLNDLVQENEERFNALDRQLIEIKAYLIKSLAGPHKGDP